MRKRELRRVYEAAKQITARRCDVFVPPYTCITEDDGKEPWSPCDPCLLAQAGVPVSAEAEEWPGPVLTSSDHPTPSTAPHRQ